MLMPFLVVCPLVGLAGFVDAIAGGGGLISLPAYLMAGLPPHMCLGTNKLSSCMGTALATVRFALRGFIDWRGALPCVACALVGSALGAQSALLISDEVLRWVMLAVVPLTALYVLRPKSLRPPEDPRHARQAVGICALISVCIGFYDGIYGPGTGTFLMLGFMTVAKLGLNESAGITKAVNLTTNIAALTVFLLNGQVWLLLGLTAGLFNMLGAWLGVTLFTGKGIKVVKPIILVVLVVFFVKMLVELLA